MQVKQCQSYNARFLQRELLRLPDGQSVFKLYFLDITGRSDRARYEWEFSAIRPQKLLETLTHAGLEGIGFVTAFPHITKVFRFAPDMETVLHVKAFRTDGLAPIDLVRRDGYCEFACYAEAILAAGEYAAWARSGTVAEYLDFLADMPDGLIATPGKMATHFNVPA